MASSLLVAPSALAATEIGDTCVGDATAPNQTAILLHNGAGLAFGGSIPQGGNALLTRWKVTLGPGMGPLQQQLIVVRSSGEGQEFRKIAESPVETAVEGTNEFATRLMVPEYARIGLSGPTATAVCDEAEGHGVGLIENPFLLGEARPSNTEFGTGVPVRAIFEPDSDGDGFSDQTEDRCPRDPTRTSNCPIGLTGYVTSFKPNAILFEVAATGVPATVEVFGRVTWRLPPKPNPVASGRRRPGRFFSVPLSGGPARAVGPSGLSTIFRLPLAKAVLRRLGELPRQRFLRAKITMRATSEAGLVEEVTRNETLRGRAKPKR